MGFPVVPARGISFLRDLEEQDTDGKLSAVTLQELVPALPPSWNSPSEHKEQMALGEHFPADFSAGLQPLGDDTMKAIRHFCLCGLNHSNSPD